MKVALLCYFPPRHEQGRERSRLLWEGNVGVLSPRARKGTSMRRQNHGTMNNVNWVRTVDVVAEDREERKIIRSPAS